MNSSPIDKKLRDEHTHDAIVRRINSANRPSYFGDFVLGAVDGAVTTFAIVAGSAGAGISSGAALVLGVANVLADGLSMAAGNFLRSKAEMQVAERFRRMEEMHIDLIPDGEREEIRQIFRQKGFEDELLEDVVSVITSDRERWVNTMLAEEWGLSLEYASPTKTAAVTYLAFVVAGVIPLLPLVVDLRSSATQQFLPSCILTALAFFLVGWLRGIVTERSRWANAIETVLLGGAAAMVAYLVGAMLRDLAF
ncbi:MAG: VIT1/CCC1 transporter family protein [Planctomycetales bacterium]|nr:VIT1/CCC1 transporter family protein [Planctomycetales bacterium]